MAVTLIPLLPSLHPLHPLSSIPLPPCHPPCHPVSRWLKFVAGGTDIRISHFSWLEKQLLQLVYYSIYAHFKIIDHNSYPFSFLQLFKCLLKALSSCWKKYHTHTPYLPPWLNQFLLTRDRVSQFIIERVIGSSPHWLHFTSLEACWCDAALGRPQKQDSCKVVSMGGWWTHTYMSWPSCIAMQISELGSYFVLPLILVGHGKNIQPW